MKIGATKTDENYRIPYAGKIKQRYLADIITRSYKIVIRPVLKHVTGTRTASAIT